MTIYAITGTRKAAALYFQKEYGTALAFKKLQWLEKTQNGLYAIEQCKGLKAVKSLANKVQFITAYQQGRLGQRLGEGHALTISIVRS